MLVVTGLLGFTPAVSDTSRWTGPALQPAVTDEVSLLRLSHQQQLSTKAIQKQQHHFLLLRDYTPREDWLQCPRQGLLRLCLVSWRIRMLLGNFPSARSVDAPEMVAGG